MNKTIDNKEVDRKSNVQFLHTANSDSMNKIIQGDCLEKLKDIPDNYIDAIVTDPPYEIGFMGKKWDSTGIAYNVELWKECLRILKPGGHILAFGGTRTYHRMACAIEDAGFEVRDTIVWAYGSGFPKSLNIGKSVNQLETKEWSKIEKALDNIDIFAIIDIWKSNSNNVKIVETQSLKNQTIVGQDMLSENFVVLNVAQNINQENSNLFVSFAEQNLSEAQATKTKINIALQNVDTEIRQLQNNVKFAEKQLQDQYHKSWSIFTAQCDVKEWLNENTEVKHKVDEALKTLRGNKKYSNEEITNVLCVVLPNILKLTILNQSKTFQNLDTNQKMECVSAINVIITEYTAENLISNTVAILKSKAVDKLQGNEREVVGKIAQPGSTNKRIAMGNGWQEEPDLTKGTSEWEGWGTALKPAHEPICMARKPLAEKTVAENVLKYGTGGINIDESRVDYNGEVPNIGGRANHTRGDGYGFKELGDKIEVNTQGRFPANLIHDNSDEVRECFPDSKAGRYKGEGSKSGGIWSKSTGKPAGMEYGDSGNASRFFKSIIYQAKASKSERNKGCEGLEEKIQNNHPTVKPIALMEYLIKMVTPKGGIVLDPFAGSGTTLVAAKQNGFKYIGIEIDPEYIKIIKARLNEL